MTKVYNRASEKEMRQRLRRNMPEAEALLWARLRGRQVLGYKFRRQFSVGPYSVDFYCPELKLAIEVDGDSHLSEEAIAYDRERQGYIEAFGIRFLRFTNPEVYKNNNDVVNSIAQTVLKLKQEDLSPALLLTKKGKGEVEKELVDWKTLNQNSPK